MRWRKGFDSTTFIIVLLRSTIQYNININSYCLFHFLKSFSYLCSKFITNFSSYFDGQPAICLRQKGHGDNTCLFGLRRADQCVRWGATVGLSINGRCKVWSKSARDFIETCHLSPCFWKNTGEPTWHALADFTTCQSTRDHATNPGVHICFALYSRFSWCAAGHKTRPKFPRRRSF